MNHKTKQYKKLIDRKNELIEEIASYSYKIAADKHFLSTAKQYRTNLNYLLRELRKCINSIIEYRKINMMYQKPKSYKINWYNGKYEETEPTTEQLQAINEPRKTTNIKHKYK